MSREPFPADTATASPSTTATTSATTTSYPELFREQLQSTLAAQFEAAPDLTPATDVTITCDLPETVPDQPVADLPEDNYDIQPAESTPDANTDEPAERPQIATTADIVVYRHNTPLHVVHLFVSGTPSLPEPRAPDLARAHAQMHGLKAAAAPASPPSALFIRVSLPQNTLDRTELTYTEQSWAVYRTILVDCLPDDLFE